MNILYLVADGPHAHDYGVDWLYAGFRQLAGDGVEIYDWPEKPPLHLTQGTERDDCNIDSDQWWPRRDYGLTDVLREPLDSDLVILTAADPALASACRMIPSRVPLVGVDMGDALGNRRDEYEAVAGRRLHAYFKRELPLGSTWAIPLPLTYPQVELLTVGRWRLCYHATDHGGGAPGIPRRRIVERLRELLPETILDVALYPGQGKGTRPDPDEYHRHLNKALVGISWNGAPNWDCNRFWENFAYGVAQVAERPRIQIPDAPLHRTHCLYATTPDEVAELAAWLMQHPGIARDIAAKGNAHFLQYHQTSARARYLLRESGVA